MNQDVCKYCGQPAHCSGLVVCERENEHPLPYKTIGVAFSRVRKETEPLKLYTDFIVHPERKPLIKSNVMAFAKMFNNKPNTHE